jgi:hypothetical protein
MGGAKVALRVRSARLSVRARAVVGPKEEGTGSRGRAGRSGAGAWRRCRPFGAWGAAACAAWAEAQGYRLTPRARLETGGGGEGGAGRGGSTDLRTGQWHRSGARSGAEGASSSAPAGAGSTGEPAFHGLRSGRLSATCAAPAATFRRPAGARTHSLTLGARWLRAAASVGPKMGDSVARGRWLVSPKGLNAHGRGWRRPCDDTPGRGSEKTGSPKGCTWGGGHQSQRYRSSHSTPYFLRNARTSSLKSTVL